MGSGNTQVILKQSDQTPANHAPLSIRERPIAGLLIYPRAQPKVRICLRPRAARDASTFGEMSRHSMIFKSQPRQGIEDGINNFDGHQVCVSELATRRGYSSIPHERNSRSEDNGTTLRY